MTTSIPTEVAAALRRLADLVESGEAIVEYTKKTSASSHLVVGGKGTTTSFIIDGESVEATIAEAYGSSQGATLRYKCKP
jgi:hypothetical protein